MIKKKKVARFRELYDVINDLLDSYTYDDVVEILARDHDFKIQANTLTHYVYKHRKMLKELGDKKGDERPVAEPSHNPIEVSKSSSDEKNSVLLENQEKPELPKQKMDVDAALAKFKDRQQNKSLFDKK